eukprot:257846-Prymnesium_polylepis.1
MAISRALGGLAVLVLAAAQLDPADIDAMVAAGEAIVQSAILMDDGWARDRYQVAAEGIQTTEMAAGGVQADLHGVYGEFPLRGIAELLMHPAVGPVLSFVDIGSGAGRLLLGVAGMLGEGAAVAGIEASSALHAIAAKSIDHIVEQRKLRAGAVSSLHADVIAEQPPSMTTASTLARADLVFCYSTAF